MIIFITYLPLSCSSLISHAGVAVEMQALFVFDSH